MPVMAVTAGYALFRAQSFEMPFAHADLVAHAALFAAITLYALFAGRYRPHIVLRLILALAVGSELLQSTAMLPMRVASVSDVVANLAGVILGMFIVQVFRPRTPV